MKNLIFLVFRGILFFMPVSNFFAQAIPHCGNSPEWEAELSDPVQQARRQVMEAAIAEAMQRDDAITSRSPIVIPVVVHVVWRDPEENIDDARIWSQIERLNLDFNAENEDIDQVPDEFKPFVGNPGIRFCLAAEDPAGNPTNGIVRVQTTERGIAMKRDNLFYSDRGGSNAWDPTRYLNIWTGDNFTPNGISVTGYAYSPWTETPERSGIVISLDFFGINDSRLGMGRLAVHEVGHYLGLRHIWGDNSPPTCNDDDGISDTPNQFFYNFNCPSYPQHSCDGTSNMFMNYMDYVYDRCMMMFTKEQTQLMNAVLALYRPGLLNTTIPCVQKPERVFADAFTVYPNPARRAIYLNFAEQVAEPGEILLYNINGRVVFREFFILRNGMEVMLHDLIPGMYFLRIGESMRKLIVHP